MEVTIMAVMWTYTLMRDLKKSVGFPGMCSWVDLNAAVVLNDDHGLNFV